MQYWNRDAASEDQAEDRLEAAKDFLAASASAFEATHDSH